MSLRPESTDADDDRTTIPTDLITPLAAYLRLRARRGGARSCSSPSTRAGSGATASWAAGGASSRSRRRSSSASRSSATSATTSSRSSSRPCRFQRRPGLPGEPVRRAELARPLRPCPRRRGGARGRSGGAARAARRAGAGGAARRTAPRGPLRRFPDQAEHERRSAGEGAHQGRRRVPDRRRPARRSPHLGFGVRALPGAAPRQPVAVPLPSRAPRHGARRLLARDGRQVRGPARDAEPDRGDDQARPRATSRRCSRPRRTGPSTSCSSTSGATTSRASAARDGARRALHGGRSATRT